MEHVQDVDKQNCLIPPVHFLSAFEVKPEGSCFQCSLCEFYFDSQEDLNLHRNSETGLSIDVPLSESSFFCPKCKNEFFSYLGMRQHYGKVHTLERKVKCKICSSRFKDSYALKYHKRQVHDKSTHVKCSLCNKVLYRKYNFASHMKKCPFKNLANP